jgi:Mrp family chromosome partitioning ATPase
MGDSLREMMKELKAKYDYIILDTPPLGLVTDALELSNYADVTIYVMRQNVTKKNMTTLLNNAVKRGELSNVSIILNGFENKAKYGASYGYGHGYGTYDDSYFESKKRNNFFSKLVKHFKS